MKKEKGECSDLPLFGSRKFDKKQPPPEKCLDCGEKIEAQKLGEYGWIYICEKCETNWEA